MNEIVEFLKLAFAILLPIALYILAGYYASNAQWCTRKILVAVVTGLAIGLYGLIQGIDVNESWITLAFASAPALGAMYLIDRVVKGIAKRAGIDWLYTDDPIGEVIE